MIFSRFFLKSITLFFAFALSFSMYPQRAFVDSLRFILKKAKDDTSKVAILNDLSWKFLTTGKYDSAIVYANQAVYLAKKLFPKGSIAEGRAYNTIGNSYYKQGNYPVALKNHIQALKIREAIDDKQGIAGSYNNIGNLYINEGNLTLALKNHLAALKIREALNDKQGIAYSRNNLGNVYFSQGNFPMALENYMVALKIKEELKDKQGIAISYNNIGAVYEKQGSYFDAIKNFQASLNIRQEIGDKSGIALSCNNIGVVYNKMKNATEGKKWLEKGLRLSLEIGSLDDMKESYAGLADAEQDLGNYKAALLNFKQFIKYRDSVLNEENRNKNIQTQMQYEFDKKEAATKLEQEKKDVIIASEKRKQTIIIYAVTIGLLLLLFIIVVIYRSLKVTQLQKKIIDFKSEQLTEAIKDIKDSITYAKRIQHAKLPKKEEIYRALKDSFILFKPKDIVSGDFYFFQQKENVLFIAAADCTGHGVPGAFMSMIGSERLEDALIHTIDVSKILSHLNKGIKSSLKQSDNDDSTRDGIDIALCVIDIEQRIVKYAGANRPFWLIRNLNSETINQVEEIKATKKAIGGFTEDDQVFEAHEVSLKKGDTFYIFSDGYADTFGGDGNKKLTTKRFKEILLALQDKTMREQEQYLNDFIEEWKGSTEQVDDILVIGVRV